MGLELVKLKTAASELFKSAPNPVEDKVKSDKSDKVIRKKP